MVDDWISLVLGDAERMQAGDIDFSSRILGLFCSVFFCFRGERFAVTNSNTAQSYGSKATSVRDQCDTVSVQLSDLVAKTSPLPELLGLRFFVFETWAARATFHSSSTYQPPAAHLTSVNVWEVLRLLVSEKQLCAVVCVTWRVGMKLEHFEF